MHINNHAEFMNQVSVMWNSRSSMSNPAEVLHGFLRAWLGFHILGVDQAMSKQLRLIESGHTPAEAFEMGSARQDTAINALLQALHNLYHVLSIQNKDLSVANQDLEKKVQLRTSELGLANQALRGLNQQLEALSNSDGLLGIANRRYFDVRLEEEWSRATREQQPLSLLMIDVDNFKHYNDKYGHQAGDHCLQAVSQAVKSVLKRSIDLLGRYGGEELVVILANTDLQGAIVVANEIKRELDQRHIPHADAPVADHVTVSIGAATMIPAPHNSSALLIAKADRGLYRAKESGRNQVCTDESTHEG